MSELAPIFTVQVWLDGDDDAKEQTENIKSYLLSQLEDMQQDKDFLHYTLEVST